MRLDVSGARQHGADARQRDQRGSDDARGRDCKREISRGNRATLLRTEAAARDQGGGTRKTLPALRGVWDVWALVCAFEAAVGVVGDLVLVFQTELTAYVGKAPFLVQLVQAALRPGLWSGFGAAEWSFRPLRRPWPSLSACRSQDPKLLQSAQWLQGMLMKLRSQLPQLGRSDVRIF